MSTGQEESLVRLRKLVTFDRLLARLNLVAPGSWILKGGVALDIRLGNRARMTNDLDLASRYDEQAAAEFFLVATELSLEDYFSFSVRRSDGTTGESTLRYHVQADVAGRRFESVILDIGLGDPVPHVVNMLDGTAILSFAGIAPVQIPVLPLEYHLAEKLHAYSLQYDDNRVNTRVKDLVDIILISRYGSFNALVLREAIDQTFRSRATHAVPRKFPLPPGEWATPYRLMALTVRLDPELHEGYQIASSFLNPVLNAAPAAAQWNPSMAEWVEVE